MPEGAALTGVDFERHLLAHATLIAPSDVTALVGGAGALRHRLLGERMIHPALAERARIALDLLADHSRGACPQIPFYTVSLLTTALLYYLAPMDVIPDFIPRVGTADDALVLDIAWRLAAPGIQRYIDAKELGAIGDATEPTGAQVRSRRARPTAARTKAGAEAKAKRATPVTRRGKGRTPSHAKPTRRR